MMANVMEKLKERGWYISEHGYNLASDSGNISDIGRIIKRCLDFDLREVGSGQGNFHQGNIVLQVQKLRNVAAPKSNEESRSAPRMLKLSLTDGKKNIQAVEVEHISSLSLNTPPGTKLLLRSGNVPMLHGIILLSPLHIECVLGGRVANLVEKWELNKKLASHTRVRSSDEGGPPPWIPFGKTIIKASEQDKNFKALAEKEKSSKENTEFEAQRKDAIAEAAKQGSKKVFGGGNKTLLDHSVQKIVDHGFSISQAEYALKLNRNNIDRALKSLQKTDNKQNSREPREAREARSKRFDKKTEESKPSSGKISLFDFLEDKLPVQPDTAEKTISLQNSENTFENTEMRSNDMQIGRGGRSQKGGRGYQAPPRYLEDNRNSKKPYSSSSTSIQYTQYNGNSNTQQTKPPRFQRNQDVQNYYQQDSGGRNVNSRSSQVNDYKHCGGQSHIEGVNITDSGSYKNPQDQQGKNSGSNRGHNYLESDARNRQSYDASYGRHTRAQQDGTHKAYAANTTDKNYKNQLNRYPNDNIGGRGSTGSNSQRSRNHFSSNQTASTPIESSWVWRIGDKCLAKYWEDNRYYNAVVTGVSERTCVVQFKGFENYEEVLQMDCLPITDDQEQSVQEYDGEARQQVQYPVNRQARYDPSQSHTGMEFRRGGSGAVSSSKGYGKKRGQRNSQPIYQPPAQRSHNCMPTNTQNNSLL